MKKPDLVSLEDMLKQSNGSVYQLTILLAKRALQIADGAKSMINQKPEDKPIEVALREIKAGKIKAVEKKPILI